MQILLANAIETFQDARSQRVLCDRIYRILSNDGHRVDRLTLPYVENLETVMEQLLSYRLLDLPPTVDRLIALDAPACFLAHPNKVTIVSSIYRPLCSFSLKTGSPIHESAITQKIERARSAVFGESKAIFFDTNTTKQSWRSKHLDPTVFANCLEHQTDDEIAKLLTLHSDRYATTFRSKRSAGRAA
jgi:hypothetical protein